MSTATIGLADFSKFPAARFRKDGPASGEAFRDDHLLPALRQNARVIIVFDGIAGCGSGFLEEAFGGLVRVRGYSAEFLSASLALHTSDRDLDDAVDFARECIGAAESLEIVYDPVDGR